MADLPPGWIEVCDMGTLIAQTTSKAQGVRFYFFSKIRQISFPSNTFRYGHFFARFRSRADGRVYADSPGDCPEWGLRAVATFLFPTGG